MTNRPVDARQPTPAGVTERNQPVVQHPDITEPTGLWREQGVEAQPERIEHSHLSSITSSPGGGAKANLFQR